MFSRCLRAFVPARCIAYLPGCRSATSLAADVTSIDATRQVRMLVCSVNANVLVGDASYLHRNAVFCALSWCRFRAIPCCGNHEDRVRCY